MVMHGFGIGKVRGSILGRTKLNSIFAKLSFWLEYEGVEKTLTKWAAKGGWKSRPYVTLIGNYILFNANFVFRTIKSN